MTSNKNPWPRTPVVRALLEAAADPARASELASLLIAPELTAAMTTAADIDTKLRRLRDRYTAQAETTGAAAAQEQDAKEAHGRALAVQSVAIDENEIADSAAAVKGSLQAEQHAAQVHAAAARLLGAIRSHISEVELEQATAAQSLATQQLEHKARLSALVAAELRADLQAFEPLLKFAAAIASGSQNFSMSSRLAEGRIADPTGGFGPMLDGTKCATGEMAPLPGSTIKLPVMVDLADGWQADAALQAIAAAAGLPLVLERRLKSYVTLAQVEAERAAAEAHSRRPMPMGRGPATVGARPTQPADRPQSRAEFLA